MKVFVAGASGAIGRPLLRQLVAAGHEVTGTTRSAERAEEIRAGGRVPVGLRRSSIAEALKAAVAEAAPEVVINQLTSLPRDYNPRQLDYGPTNRVRTEGGGNLIEAAREAGARRFVTQSISFMYAPEGEWVKDEEARLLTDAPGAFATGVRAMTRARARGPRAPPASRALVLRYGWFYGPGTYYASDGSIAEQVRKRRFPMVGKGRAMFSFLHVEDAAGATVVASRSGGRPGIYNVVDDEPAPFAEWLPVYAEALGAKRPWRVPAFIARLVAGAGAAALATQLRGASNAKAKRELGWQPRYPSWRQGFREALG